MRNTKRNSRIKPRRLNEKRRRSTRRNSRRVR
jgi:hypothetical protein